MSFLSPAFLLGLPLVAVPVVIHLLSRRQKKWIAWGAMRFLTQAATRKRRWWRLTDLLLLLLRVVALLFFIGALARPMFPARWLGGTVPRDIILVLDASLSMSRKENGSSLFARAVEAAGRELDGMSRADGVRVLLAGEAPEWFVAESIPGEPGALRRLKERLAALQPTLAAGDVAGCLREAAELEPPKDKSARSIFLITDGQRFGWRLDEEPFWESLRGRLGESTIPTSVGIRFVGRAGAGPNLAVNRIDTPRTQSAVGLLVVFTANLENHGDRASAATLLAWRVNGEAAGVSTVPSLAPGAATTLTLTHAFAKPGTHDVSGQVEGQDDLPGDDSGRVLVEVHERLPVLLVGGDGVVDAAGPGDDLAFVLAALGFGSGAAAEGWKSVFSPTVIRASALATTDLRGYRCVVLADVGELTVADVGRLEDYVTGGGGVWLAPGPHVEPRWFNQRFVRGDSGLAPLALGVTVGDAEDREHFTTVRAASDSHPATALLSDFQRLDLDRARIYRRHVFEAGRNRHVSVLLQAQDGEAVVVERKLGRGRVLVQAVPLGLSWSTLPLCQAYVAMLHEWLWYLSEPDLPRRNLAVGEELVEPARGTNGVATLTTPDGGEVEVRPEMVRGENAFRSGATRWPGRYELTHSRPGVPPETATFQVRRNPRESTLAGLTAEDRIRLAGTKALRLDSGLAGWGVEGEVEAPKHSLEGWLLGALPFVLLGEMLLASWTTGRRQARPRPVVMEGIVR